MQKDFMFAWLTGASGRALESQEYPVIEVISNSLFFARQRPAMPTLPFSYGHYNVPVQGVLQSYVSLVSVLKPTP